eukprot:TRINITY_DN1242_c0_g1_i1.p1 TRINITY_DN1242_c0_g1~~TRINITY_DN1242_c0_g1_i1.p1  ORF type:complete len:437 (+),score=145.95 TRINITY_DN1242_c0_g1_i1:78-1388(+)
MDSSSFEDSSSRIIVDGEVFYTPMSTQKDGPVGKKDPHYDANLKGSASLSRDREHAGFLSEGTMSYLGSIAKTKKEKSAQDADRESDKKAIDEILRRYDEEVFAPGVPPRPRGSTPTSVPLSKRREGTSASGITASTTSGAGNEAERKETERIVKEWEKIHKEWSESKSRLASSPSDTQLPQSFESPGDHHEDVESIGRGRTKKKTDRLQDQDDVAQSLASPEVHLVDDGEEPLFMRHDKDHSPREQEAVRKSATESDEEEEVVVQDDETDPNVTDREQDPDEWNEDVPDRQSSLMHESPDPNESTGDELVDLLVNRPRKKNPEDLCTFSLDLLSVLDSIGMDGEEDSLERFRSQLRAILSQRERIYARSDQLRRMHLGVLLERKMYLRKLRAIERFGRDQGWRSSAEYPVLHLVQDILYKESDLFELQGRLEPYH